MKKRKAPFPWGIGLAKLGPRKYLFDANLAVNLDFIEQQGFDLVEAVDETSQTVVWKAVQRTLERTVILRILKPEAASDPAAVAHFLNIARIVSRIKSESLAAIFDIVSNKGLYYIVMEHVNGPTLEEEVSADGPLPLERILRIAASLIVSLDQLWGLVYRTPQPEKLDPDSRRGVSKITDFQPGHPSLTGVNATAMDEGNIVGTPCFLSPEQAQGSHTHHAVGYVCVGNMLYHLSTGTVPLKMRMWSPSAAHVKRQIPPPHHLNPALSPFFVVASPLDDGTRATAIPTGRVSCRHPPLLAGTSRVAPIPTMGFSAQLRPLKTTPPPHQPIKRTSRSSGSSLSAAPTAVWPPTAPKTLRKSTPATSGAKH